MEKIEKAKKCNGNIGDLKKTFGKKSCVVTCNLHQISSMVTGITLTLIILFCPYRVHHSDGSLDAKEIKVPQRVLPAFSVEVYWILAGIFAASLAWNIFFWIFSVLCDEFRFDPPDDEADIDVEYRFELSEENDHALCKNACPHEKYNIKG